MTWWRRLVGGSSGRDPRHTDFLAEALDLESRGDYANALTSYRLALRERPDDLGVLQNIAMQNNLPETAFVRQVGSNGRCHLRWFTPEFEIDLCGHATLATSFVLFDILYWVT